MPAANTKVSNPLTFEERTGFTLIELLLVLAVLSTLLVLAVPTMSSIVDRTNSQSCLQDVRASLLAARQLAIDEGRVVQWNVETKRMPAVSRSLPNDRSTAKLQYSIQRDDLVVQLFVNGPLVFRPNGTAVDAKITLLDSGMEIGSLYVVGATGAIKSEKLR